MIPLPLGSFSLSASTTHHRTMSGSTSVPAPAPSLQCTGGRESKSNQAASDDGVLDFRPRAASAPRARGERNSPTSPPHSPNAANRAARTSSRLSLRTAAASTGTDASRPSEPTQAAAEARTSALRSPSACSARTRTRGCERSTACARGRFTFESPTAISATTADSPAGTRGMAPRISRARTTESGLPSASRSSPGRSANHAHDTSTSVSWKT